MKFLKLSKSIALEMSFTAHQVIELTSIFRRVMKEKNVLLMRVLRVCDNFYYSKANEKVQVLQRDELEAVMRQIKCLKEFTDCLNLEVIAKRLSSPKVRVEIQLNGENDCHLVVSSRKKGNKYSKNVYYLSSSLWWLRMRLFILYHMPRYTLKNWVLVWKSQFKRGSVQQINRHSIFFTNNGNKTINRAKINKELSDIDKKNLEIRTTMNIWVENTDFSWIKNINMLNHLLILFLVNRQMRKV